MSALVKQMIVLQTMTTKLSLASVEQCEHLVA